MICDHCGDNNATVHVVRHIGDKHEELNLCRACAAKLQHEMLQSALGNIGLVSSTPPVPSLTCPTCHMTADEFKRTGRLGCTDCYRVFSSMILPLVRRAQNGAAAHTGTRPGDGKVTVSPAPARSDPRAELEKKLAEAIASEAYEEAAVLRDKIRALDKKEG
nr:UvrB/UvrC motif-containing protein [bacterium]